MNYKALNAKLSQPFLSCLCGSELDEAHEAMPDIFLSCLCGSELEKNHQKLNPHVTKPRISSARP